MFEIVYVLRVHNFVWKCRNLWDHVLSLQQKVRGMWRYEVMCLACQLTVDANTVNGRGSVLGWLVGWWYNIGLNGLMLAWYSTKSADYCARQDKTRKVGQLFSADISCHTSDFYRPIFFVCAWPQNGRLLRWQSVGNDCVVLMYEKEKEEN